MTKFEELNNAVCVITGGTGVLGRAIADELGKWGAVPVLADLKSQVGGGPGDETWSTIEMDVADEVSVGSAFEEVVADKGRLDVLVNCAGFEQSSCVDELSVDDWSRMVAVHLTGTFLCSKRAFSYMSEEGAGKIINVSSQLAYKGSAGLAHYCAAKAGVLGFTRAFAREAIAQNVHVNAIAPGPVDSPVLRACGEDFLRRKLAEMPVGRVGTPEEIAGTALLLASSYGDFYVGQTLAPCGGDVML